MTDRIVLYVNGAVAFDNQAGPAAPSFPIPSGGGSPIPPSLPPANYPGPNMWDYATKRRGVLLTKANPISRGGFTVPPGGANAELMVSGANINMSVDGVLTGGELTFYAAGPHTFDAILTSAAESAEGSITVQH